MKSLRLFVISCVAALFYAAFASAVPVPIGGGGRSSGGGGAAPTATPTPTFVNASCASVITGTQTVAFPSGTQAGDIVFVGWISFASTTGLPLTQGWGINQGSASAGNTGIATHVYVGDGSDTGLSLNSAGSGQCYCVASYRGTNLNIDTSAAIVVGLTPNSITTHATNAIVVQFSDWDTVSTFTSASTGFTDRAHQNPLNGAYSCDIEDMNQAVAGSVTGNPITLSGAAGNADSAMTAFQP